jgi:hypothetical protein
MSFYEDNKFFITQKLQVSMRGLTLEERQTNYNTIKFNIRERILKSYPKQNNISDDVIEIEINKFYGQLFEYVGEFDLNYILGNLFFENNITQIIHYLKNNSKYFNNLLDSPSLDKLSFTLIKFIKLNNFFPSNFLEFLINIIYDKTSLSLLDLEYGNGDLGFSIKYPKWLIENLSGKEDIESIIFIHLVVIKYLNIKNLFIGYELSNKSAIQFIYYLNKTYDESINSGYSPKIFNFRFQLSTFLNTLFIKDYIVKSPILTTEGNHLSKGFYIQRTKFLDRIDQAEILNNDMSSEEYSYLFASLINCSDKLKNKIILEIKNKINSFEYPDDLDLITINQNRENSLTIDNLFKKSFYLFEI